VAKQNSSKIDPLRHPKAVEDELEVALEVLEEDASRYPGTPDQLMTRSPETGMPEWFPMFHPATGEKFRSPSERRSALLEMIQMTPPAVSLRRPLSPTERQKLVTVFRRIAYELRSQGFDIPE
jgi:hypothetical protein